MNTLVQTPQGLFDQIHNPILDSDSYKFSMPAQYPKGTKFVHSYIEARLKNSRTAFFGLQYWLKTVASRRISMNDIAIAEAVAKGNGIPFFREKWEYIVNEHNGKLPVEIKALPEGSVAPTGTPLVSIQNTDPECYWLTTHLETGALRAVWYGSTVATISFEIKKYLAEKMEETCDNLEGIPYKLNDFGSRGASSAETAMFGGMAHLTQFMGTDTITALLGANFAYNAPIETIGHSIPAMEHSTVTSWTKLFESEAFKNMLNTYGGDYMLIAAVSDSYDFKNCVDNIWGKALKQEVVDSGSILVVRPDSGDAVENVVYALNSLSESYGYTVNSKGYKVLNNVRIIQGDGIELKTIKLITEAVTKAGFSIDNVNFGMGGALLQQCDRDWYAWAMKCSAIKKEEWTDVFKAPITDPTKKSKSGKFIVQKVGLDFSWKVAEDYDADYDNNALQTVFLNGNLVNELTFADVRSNSEAYL